MDDFPYKRNFQSQEDIEKMFKNLKRFEPRLTKGTTKIFNMKHYQPLFQNSPYYIKVEDYDYTECDNITDYFSEQERVRCKRKGDAYSVHEFWRKNKEMISQKCLKKFGDTSPFHMRETIFDIKYECTSFKPSLMVAFIRLFGATRILDFSSGWGDRLIAALAVGVDYTGVDPNKNLFPCYKKIVEFFKPKREPIMINAPFEEVSLYQQYDMIFTSPPYFDLELYNGEFQSYLKKNGDKKTLEEWYNSFLMVSMKKAWDCLTSRGTMIININDIKDKEPYVLKMVEDIKKFKDCNYRGCITQWSGKKWKSAQPFWIFTKI